MTDAEIIEEILDMLNGTNSPTDTLADKETLLEEFSNVLDICSDRKKQLDEIWESIGGYQ
jgi:RNAse (barnase) inhibitor barstar